MPHGMLFDVMKIARALEMNDLDILNLVQRQQLIIL